MPAITRKYTFAILVNLRRGGGGCERLQVELRVASLAVRLRDGGEEAVAACVVHALPPGIRGDARAQ